MKYKDYEDWQAAVKKAYPEYAAKMKFKGRVEQGQDTISAEVPGLDRCFGVWSQDMEEGEVVMAKLQAATRLKASLANPAAGGANYDLLIDGDPSEDTPIVQELTHDDGGVERPREQNLLMNDLGIE